LTAIAALPVAALIPAARRGGGTLGLATRLRRIACELLLEPADDRRLDRR
jgi:hypothetical protein